ncbi:MAG: DNA/RNA nuclease SfsA [Gammaproteobacteria bacterium]|nr:MAG: DNA/RNA nuclease SfsA [Gammaproteobacteria bacterium]RLA15942.1 MAG: DNA/RNA nuclease SfsA [Gammaproteobacteria bacterium]RLA16975.1 MAG: DNA/RNA nuclease SfsA [Gammaproteobacteria bacterium]
MQLPSLTQGVLHRRYKRFLADITLDDGREIVAHCPNTGRMTSCWQPGAPVQVSHSDNPKRKLAWTLERVDMGGGWIGVHTGRVNEVIAEAIAAGGIESLKGYQTLKREVVFNTDDHRARLDIQLSDGKSADAWVEVKNATLLLGDQVQFPDAVTERGLKHLNVLAELVANGNRGVLVFAINRSEGTSFSVADSVDPAYGQRLREVIELGVEVVAPRLIHHPQSITVEGTLPVTLPSALE